ncbi:MAG: DNA polymerase IV [Deltaproteobacteria bacterium]
MVRETAPIVTARRKCPHGIFLPVRMKRYQQVSTVIMAIFRRFTPLVEPLSLDEAFLDVTGSTALFGSVEEIAIRIKQQVKEVTGLTVSAGVASSKLVAKIASDLRKPDGLVVVAPGTEENFLEDLPIGKLWGVGKVTREELQQLGIRSIGDVRRFSLAYLSGKFGKLGEHLYLTARGIDPRPVVPEHETKSIGNEETYDHDLIVLADIRREILALCHQVAGRLRRHGLRGKTLTLKVKYHDFKQITRSTTLRTPTDDQKVLYRHVLDLLPKTEAGSKPIRLLGISMSQFERAEYGQLALFAGETDQQRRSRLNTALDRITARYGKKAVQPGTLVTEEDGEEER